MNFNNRQVSVIVAVLTLFLLHPILAHELNSLKDDYEKKQFKLRKIINHSSIIYPDPPLDSSLVFAEFMDERMFLYRKDRIVTINKIKFENSGTKISIQYDSDITQKQEIGIFSPTEKSITYELFLSLFNRIFTLPSDENEFKYFAIDTLRKRIHVRGSNHIDLKWTYVTESELVKYDDYAFCLACKMDESKIENLDVELALAQACAAEYRKYNMVITDDSLQDMIENVGQRIISNWPLELRGYNYKFIIVDNSYPNALALPGGIIFIHTGLIDLCENDMELESIIAHEIAHVELRHGYRTFLKDQKSRLIGSIATLAAGIIVGLSTDDVDATRLSLDIAKSIADISSTLALAGYSREYEREADEIATLYMYTRYNDKENIYLKNILNKIKYAYNETEYDLKLNPSATHPPIIARILAINSLSFKHFIEPISYCGYDSLRREVCRLNIYYATTWAYERPKDLTHKYETVYVTNLYTSLESNELLYETSKAKEFVIWNKGERLYFDNKEDTYICPLSKTNCVFKNETITPISLDDFVNFKSFHLPIGPVQLWRKI